MTSVQDLSCIFCKESFEDKETLQIHFRKHGDPKFNQTIKPKNRNQNESPTASDASKDENDMVSCDVCSEVFPTISKAITHKHKVHPDHDAKYFCPWCGKLFTLKHLYNKHLESNHDSLSNEVTRCFHCDYCDVDFFVPSAMVYHNKFFHRQDRDVPSIGYSKKVKLICQELVQIYYCPFCGEEYDNKVNLRKHITGEHIDENQSPEDILRCPLCEAIFYHLDAYELHLTFHSSEDLYNEENDMIKKITEFSLDTVPPLMEKLEAPVLDGENEDLNAISVDQFLQLTMSKDPEEEHVEPHTEKIKSKKHKKHKKSKKSITLDEFLNMNTDVFGEGLNFQGIEEVPTRVVTKQLKPKKEHGLKNQKMTGLPNNINKLQKQGIIIKRKYEKKPTSTTLTEEPNNLKPMRASPINPNIISTSSEVLSKLMSQSNNQIKVMKKTAMNNHSQELNSNENILSKEPIKELPENKGIAEETKVDNETSDKMNTDNNVQDTIPNSYDATLQENKDTSNISPDGRELISSSNEVIVNKLTENIKEPNNDDTLNINRGCKDNIENETNVDRGQTLNDFEEDLVSTKILRSDMSENLEFDCSKVRERNVNNNDTTVQDDKVQNEKNDKLNVIKHLSHLITVKSVNNFKSSSLTSVDHSADLISTQDNLDYSEHKIDNAEVRNHAEEKMKNTIVQVIKPDYKKEPSSRTLEALKNISKHVTIKPLTSEMSSSKSILKFCQDNDEPENMNELTYSTKNIVGRKVVNMKNQNQTDTLIKNSKVGTSHGIPQKIKKIQNNETHTISNNKLNTSNAIILKHLKNVIAKPIPSAMHMKNHIVQTSVHSLNTKKGNLVEKIMKREKINEEIEIFNIEDSDSDDQNEHDNSKIKILESSIRSDNKNNGSVSTSHEILRNIGKNIIVKSTNEASNNQTALKRKDFLEKNPPSSDEEEHINYNQNIFNKCNTENDKNLQSKLKNLSNEITVKSRNSSPKQSQELQNNDTVFGYDSESDSDSTIGKVKPPEIIDNILCETEFQSDEDESTSGHSLNLSDIDGNCMEEENNEEFDIENGNDQDMIKINLPKPKGSEHCPVSNFKRFNKEITIKSVNEDRNNTNIYNKEENMVKDSETLNSKESSERPLITNVPKHDKSEVEISTNEKTGNTSNQVNTINKEISVKTFQTQTVIEEITTTVTKTIRTVNQEVNNTSVTTTVPTIKTQKIVQCNQINDLRNVISCQPSTSLGKKVNTITNRCNNSKTSNLLVPIRPGVNLGKVSNSALPIKNITTPCKLALQKPIVGRALKISPQAMKQSMKRASTESAGQFSCFKKPKEPLMEVPRLKSDQDREATVHFSATQSKSDFTSTVKNVKSKSIVTSTQMKSEMSTGSHLSKLGNISGLKIIKTRSKQATLVEERAENVGNKRAMEALQKLQTQGLLIKKPRVGDSEENNYSNSDSDSNEEVC